MDLMSPHTANSLIVVIGHQKRNWQKIPVFLSSFFYFWIFIVSQSLSIVWKMPLFLTLFHSISHYSHLAVMWTFSLRLYCCTFPMNWFCNTFFFTSKTPFGNRVYLTTWTLPFFNHYEQSMAGITCILTVYSLHLAFCNEFDCYYICLFREYRMWIFSLFFCCLLCFRDTNDFCNLVEHHTDEFMWQNEFVI